MDTVFEELFDVWCPPDYPGEIPAYLKDNPTRAYGLFAFEAGFKLALRLAAGSMSENRSE